MKLKYMTVDVFTDRQFGGNPLAVVLNADGLATAQMQRIAAEFNLAETTFVLPPKSPEHTAEVRIFTPRSELPFAGHPNIGTAFVLANLGQSYGQVVTEPITFEETAGLVDIELLTTAGDVTGARLAAPQALSIGPSFPADLVAAACSIDVQDIDVSGHGPCIVSNGVPFVIAELKTQAALSAASPVTDAFVQHVPLDLATGIHLYVQTGDGAADIRARMFAPRQGIPEDPATGSANVSLIGLRAQLETDGDVVLTKTIAQGNEMGRPSLLYAEARKANDEVTGAWIGGDCVMMMEGNFQLR